MEVSARDQVDTITHVGWIGEVGVRAGASGFATPALERGREAADRCREHFSIRPDGSTALHHATVLAPLPLIPRALSARVLVPSRSQAVWSGLDIASA